MNLYGKIGLEKIYNFLIYLHLALEILNMNLVKQLSLKLVSIKMLK